MDETHFDAVVIGSGFGGAVMSYRLSEAGLRVCLLERGKPYPPGSFPRSPFKLKNNFWDPSKSLYGMFNVWSFQGLEALISSGLGGGSLIYANVLLRKDERWFVKEDLQNGGYEYWPVTRTDLDPHYAQVEKMMNVQQYPLSHPPYDRTSKTLAMKAAARKLHLDWQLPNLGVTFGNADEAPVPGEPIRESRPNLHGRTRYTCRLCGECDIGCNYGSKNTLDYTYLTEAQRCGTEIRTLCEVRTFAPRPGGGYTVSYVEHSPDPQREGEDFDSSKLALKTLHCTRLILAAGTLGSPFLLLKNRRALPKLSNTLGTRFSGNGDLLTFAVKSRETVHGETRPRVLDPSYGPVITSAIRVPDALDGGVGRGCYIEDAGYPDFVNWILEMAEAATPSGLVRSLSAARDYVMGLLGLTPQTDMSAEIERLLGSCALSSSSVPMLGMGRDVPDGRMRLRDGKYLDVEWSTRTSQAYFDRLRGTMKDIATALQADFLDNPLWYLRRVITVHPLGGCPMGRDQREGVVDAFGEVFDYPGLHVADGSVMPGPVGANPSLTIAALANRFATNILDKR